MSQNHLCPPSRLGAEPGRLSCFLGGSGWNGRQETSGGSSSNSGDTQDPERFLASMTQGMPSKQASGLLLSARGRGQGGEGTHGFLCERTEKVQPVSSERTQPQRPRDASQPPPGAASQPPPCPHHLLTPSFTLRGPLAQLGPSAGTSGPQFYAAPLGAALPAPSFRLKAGQKPAALLRLWALVTRVTGLGPVSGAHAFGPTSCSAPSPSDWPAGSLACAHGSLSPGSTRSPESRTMPGSHVL